MLTIDEDGELGQGGRRHQKPLTITHCESLGAGEQMRSATRGADVLGSGIVRTYPHMCSAAFNSRPGLGASRRIDVEVAQAHLGDKLLMTNGQATHRRSPDSVSGCRAYRDFPCIRIE